MSPVPHLAVPAQFNDPVTMVNALNRVPGLVGLSLSIPQLELDFLDLLYDSFENLLWLEIILPRRNIRSKRVDVSPKELSEGRIYKNWKLKNIAVWDGDERAHIDLMRAFKKAIPALETFWGLPIPNP